LSSREKEVLGLIAQGLSNKEIADRLCISVNTAITHRKNISSKLGIKSASARSLYALMNGLI
ncbi:MAG: LuxR C-terminal-related transcriptional regulator, partial [Muribaculaceae bacterium]|nr:LuxR C-terminal-related transcriptional regulator [Muribaculaceae bacterium]